MYERFGKRLLDVVLSGGALLILWPVMLVLTVLGAWKMKGNPFFTQPRPGRDGKIFRLIKFRSMTCQVDAQGNLLPDDQRLTRYGQILRSTSLDELPELWNIFKGDMSLIGPRPHLVRDLPFMTPRQQERHRVRQGLTGLAQVNGRNAIGWDERLAYDLQYVENITFLGDLKILWATVKAVLNPGDVTEEDAATSTELGDFLLMTGRITREEYEEKQRQGAKLLAEFEEGRK